MTNENKNRIIRLLIVQIQQLQAVQTKKGFTDIRSAEITALSNLIKEVTNL